MPPHIVRYPPIQCNTRERCDQLQIPAAPPAWRAPEGPDNLPAAPMGGGRAWPGFEGKLHHTQRRKRRRCGGRRRVRRARAGFEIDHSEPKARVWRSRGGRGMTELRGEAPPHTATQATPVWRAPKGPEGQGGLRDRPLRAEGSCVAISRAAGPDGARTPAVPQATKQQGLGAGGPGCGARGRRRGLAGLRDDAPSEARSADGSRAGRRPRAHQAARPRGRARRRPEHQRCHKQQNSKARVSEGQAAVPMGGGRAWPGFEGKLHHTQRHKHRRCGGRRRVRRARAGFEIDHSEPQARVWRSRGRPGPTAPRTPAAPPATPHTRRDWYGGYRRAHQAARPRGRARRRPEHQRRHTQREPDTRKPRPADAGRGQPTQSGGKV